MVRCGREARCLTPSSPILLLTMVIVGSTEIQDAKLFEFSDGGGSIMIDPVFP